MEKERKFLEVVVEKAAGSDRTMWFTASNETRDRDGDVLVASGWRLQNYQKNPVFLWAHQYDRPPIGKSIYIESANGQLRSKVEFVPHEIDPFAEQVRRLYEAGFMRTVSAGFIPYKIEELTEGDRKMRPEMTSGRRLSAELLEFSAVPVPSNPEALQNGFVEACVKSFTRQSDPAKYEFMLDGISPLLLVKRDGRVDMKLCKASLAALLGARGGIKGMSDDEKKNQISIIRNLGIDAKGGDLRDEFSDVWGDELLDVIHHSEEVLSREENKDNKSINNKNDEINPKVEDNLINTLRIMKDHVESLVDKLK